MNTFKLNKSKLNLVINIDQIDFIRKTNKDHYITI